jgi:hypothetical protein
MQSYTAPPVQKKGWLEFRSALVGTSLLIPVAASLFTAVLYIGLPSSVNPRLPAIAGGAFLTLILWIFIAVSYIDYTTAKGADAYSYNLLRSTFVRLEQLKQFYLPDDRPPDKLTQPSVYNSIYMAQYIPR